MLKSFWGSSASPQRGRIPRRLSCCSDVRIKALPATPLQFPECNVVALRVRPAPTVPPSLHFATSFGLQSSTLFRKTTTDSSQRKHGSCCGSTAMSYPHYGGQQIELLANFDANRSQPPSLPKTHLNVFIKLLQHAESDPRPPYRGRGQLLVHLRTECDSASDNL